MGVDLTIIPHFTESDYEFEPDVRPGYTNVRPGDWLCVIRLPLCRDYEAWERVDKLDSVPVAACLYYEDGGLTERTTDPYGSGLRHVTAGPLADALDSSDAGHHTRAAVAYLRALRPTCRVLLWWH